MMKKNYFLMLLALALLLFSCQPELESIEKKQDKDSGIGKTISFADLQAKLGNENVSKDFKILAKLTSKAPDLTDFVIDESKIIELENSSSNSNFSMVVYPKMPIDDGVFYNLVIQKINGNISKIIYKYTPETAWYNDYKNNISSPYKGKIDLIYQEGNFTAKASSKAINCRAEYIEIPCDFGYYHDDAHCEASGSYFIKITICEDTGGGSPTISYGSGSGSSGSTGGSGGSIVTPEGFENSFPYGNEYNDAYQSFKFNMHFAPNEKQWLSTHSSASVNLFWYVYNMGNTDEAFAVAKKYVQFAMAGQNLGFNVFPFSWVMDFISENPTVTAEQFTKWFVEGYTNEYKTKLLALSSSELQEFIDINP